MLYFLHIPKSAGTSLRSVFHEIYQDRLVEVYTNPNAVACRPNSVLFGHFCFSLHEFLRDQAPTYMTLLRDPVERVISWYRHQARDITSRFYQGIEQGRVSLGEIIERGLAYEVNNHAVRMICWDYSSRRGRQFRDHLSSWLLGKDISPFNARLHLHTAFERIRRYFSFVGTLGNMDRLLNTLAERNGLDPGKLPIPTVNIAPPDEIKIDSGTLELVKRANRLDSELFQFYAA